LVPVDLKAPPTPPPPYLPSLLCCRQLAAVRPPTPPPPSGVRRVAARATPRLRFPQLFSNFPNFRPAQALRSHFFLDADVYLVPIGVVVIFPTGGSQVSFFPCFPPDCIKIFVRASAFFDSPCLRTAVFKEPLTTLPFPAGKSPAVRPRRVRHSTMDRVSSRRWWFLDFYTLRISVFRRGQPFLQLSMVHPLARTTFQ